LLQRSARSLENLFLPRVREIMVSQVVTVRQDTSVMDVIEEMVNKGVGSVVIVDGSRLEGIFTRHDLMNRVIKQDKKPSEIPVKEVMPKSVITVEPEETINEAVEKMENAGVTRLVVVKDGQLKGIITKTDIRVSFSQGYMSHRLLLKKFVVDIAANFTFWATSDFVINILIVQIDFNKWMAASIIGFIVTVMLGGPFGRYLDIFRQKFHV
jgi:CBS domain-containing protein